MTLFQIITINISSIAIVFSSIALITTYRKDGHRIRLELNYLKYNCIVLGIINDSGFDTTIRSIGFFNNNTAINWLDDSATIGNNKTNSPIELPIIVTGRSTFETHLNLNNTKMSQACKNIKNAGICVQSDTGRIYVFTEQVNLQIKMQMKFSSFISKASGGRWAPWVRRPRFKTY